MKSFKWKKGWGEHSLHCFNTFIPGLIEAVHAKTARLHMALRGNFSSLENATDLVKCLKDSESLVVWTLKKFVSVWDVDFLWVTSHVEDF